MKNIYTEELRSLTVEDVYEFCDSLREENQRLEFKRELKPREMARYACAFANAEGGIMVIGIEDPDPNDPNKTKPLLFSPTSPDTASKDLARYTNAVNALVTPGLDFDVVGIGPDAANHTLVVARISASLRGPHEYLGGERPRLPIRRGHEIGELGLTDILALQSRRDGDGGTSPIKSKMSRVHIDPTHANPDIFFGMRITPATYRREERVLDLDDDRFFITLEIGTRGTDNHIHESLEFRETLLHGFYIADRAESGAQPNETTSFHKMQFDSDGDIVIRLGQRPDRKLVDQYHGTLITGYYAAQKAFRHLGLTSQANVEFRANLGSLATTEGVAKGYQDHVTIDLARDRFADTFTNVMMRMYRTVNRTTKRDDVRQALQHYADLYLREVDSLPDDWVSAS